MQKIAPPMSVTGVILFLLGLATLTPEIYFSGIMVMFTSAGLQLKALEKERLEETTPSFPPEDAYYSW